jgi:hypothetical protein
MINDLSLAGFVTSAIAHRRITFGDVRRLQRDYLPRGIESRAQAEMLTSLTTEVGHADRSWRQWFAAALTGFAARSAEGGAAARDETIAWLEHLSDKPGLARRTGRKIARQLREEAEPAETTALAVEDVSVEAVAPQEPAVAPAAQRDEPSETERRRRTRAARRSRIVVRKPPLKPARSPRKREAMPCAMMPSLWMCPPLMGEHQLQVPLAPPVE